MPIREFECPRCGFRSERLEFTPDPLPPTCPRCEDEMGHAAGRIEMERVTSAPALSFRGEGWTRPSTYVKPRRATE